MSTTTRSISMSATASRGPLQRRWPTAVGIAASRWLAHAVWDAIHHHADRVVPRGTPSCAWSATSSSPHH